MLKTSSISSRENPSDASATSRPYPPDAARYFSTTSFSCTLDPDIGTCFSIRQIHEGHARLVNFFESLAQFSRAVRCTEHFALRIANPLHFVEARHFRGRKPEPGGRSCAFGAGFVVPFQPFLDGFFHLRRQANRREIRRCRKEILGETRVRLERHDAAFELRDLGGGNVQQAFAA